MSKLFFEFADFENELELARNIYKLAFDHAPKDRRFIAFEKQPCNRGI